jgi:hypothetical protein
MLYAACLYDPMVMYWFFYFVVVIVVVVVIAIVIGFSQCIVPSITITTTVPFSH